MSRDFAVLLLGIGLGNIEAGLFIGNPTLVLAGMVVVLAGIAILAYHELYKTK